FYFSPLRSANELINTALAPYPDDLVIATKVGPSRDAQGEWQGMARPEQLRGQGEENLRQLGRDHPDLGSLRTLSGSKPGGGDLVGQQAGRRALRRAGRAPGRRAGPLPGSVQRDRRPDRRGAGDRAGRRRPKPIQYRLAAAGGR